jgi:hypothetical protein
MPTALRVSRNSRVYKGSRSCAAIVFLGDQSATPCHKFPESRSSLLAPESSDLTSSLATSRRRCPSVNRMRRLPICSRRTRFSSTKYSMMWCCRWFIQPAIEMTRKENGSRSARIAAGYHARQRLSCSEAKRFSFWTVRVSLRSALGIYRSASAVLMSSRPNSYARVIRSRLKVRGRVTSRSPAYARTEIHVFISYGPPVFVRQRVASLSRYSNATGVDLLFQRRLPVQYDDYGRLHDRRHGEEKPFSIACRVRRHEQWGERE